MNCQEVEEQLDLLAAGECDAPTRRTLESHLQSCAACAASYRASQQLLGLLDLHMNDSGPARLRRRIEQEQRRGRRQVVLPFIRRAAALAAMLLLTVGLIWLPPVWQSQRGEPDLRLAMLEVKDAVPNKAVRELLPAQPNIAIMRNGPERAQHDEKLPMPTAVTLELVLTNAGTQPVDVRLLKLSLEVRGEGEGDGVVRIPAPGVAAPAFLQLRNLPLEPGKSHIFHIDRLIAGAPGRLEYIYLTKPGEYTITANLRLTAGNAVVTLKSQPIHMNMAFP